MRVRLTDAKAVHLAVPSRGQTFYRDQELIGFALRVTAAGSRAWVVETNGRRHTIAPADKLGCKEARERACAILSEPWTAKRTLRQVFAEYEASRSLRPITVTDYRGLLNRYA